MRDPARLLVVDDDRTFRLSTAELLRHEGHEVDVAADVEEAVAKLEAASFDLMLLDVRMPKVDGLDVLRRIKGDEKLRQIPVIMLTTTGESSMIEQCYELGCCCYMVKPVNYHSFMEAVQNLGKFLSLEGMRLPSISHSEN